MEISQILATYDLQPEMSLEVGALDLQGRRATVRKRALGTRMPTAIPQVLNHRWPLDFDSDSLCRGRRFPILNVTDEHQPGVSGCRCRHLAIRRTRSKELG
jgi:hypothetical protein